MKIEEFDEYSLSEFIKNAVNTIEKVEEKHKKSKLDHVIIDVSELKTQFKIKKLKFESTLIKKEKPITTLFTDRHICLYNPKTRDMKSILPGLNIEWEYYISRGFTHWLKPCKQ